MSALDADVIKAYVELELGVGIIASMAFDPERDSGLRMLNCAHLFASSTSSLAIRRGRFLRGYVFRFIELCSPQLNEKTVRGAMASPFGLAPGPDVVNCAADLLPAGDALMMLLRSTAAGFSSARR